VAVGVIDRAITLFEHGRIEEAAHLLAVVYRSAVDANEEERLAEIDDVIGQMQAHLSGHAREAFDRAVADESASTGPHGARRRGELRSIVQQPNGSTRGRTSAIHSGHEITREKPTANITTVASVVHPDLTNGALSS
jgi:hypothetical protein